MYQPTTEELTTQPQHLRYIAHLLFPLVHQHPRFQIVADMFALKTPEAMLARYLVKIFRIGLGISCANTGEAIGEALAVLVGGVLEETVERKSLVFPNRSSESGDLTYAGALVVCRKVCLQTWHWMLMAFSFWRGLVVGRDPSLDGFTNTLGLRLSGLVVLRVALALHVGLGSL